MKSKFIAGFLRGSGAKTEADAASLWASMAEFLSPEERSRAEAGGEKSGVIFGLNARELIL